MDKQTHITVTILRHTDKYTLIQYRSNPFDTQSKIGYVSNVTLLDKKEGDTVEIPTGFKVISMNDVNGKTYTTNSGQPLSFLTW